jgi:hypothetical protein
MFLFIDADALEPKLLGFDRMGAKLERNAAGDYTIKINRAFNRPVMGFPVIAEDADASFAITEVTANSIRIVNKLGEDVDFFLQVIGSEFAYDIE